MQSYDYAHRKGVEEINWDRFSSLAAALSEGLARANIEVVVGIARAGLFPASAVACALRKEFFPVRITRRLDDRVTYRQPVWKVDVSPEVHGKVVAVIDEIADTGETLHLVAQRVQEQGAVGVVTACLVSHSWASPAPDLVALTTDALVIFPWDKQVFQDGVWQVNPELAGALKAQKE
ncbi:MAG TPA: phosphoribosyltransferase family protein [Anaerolineales bacterium]|nr:phosphoribosyltransferase family protein [Anaerolineales bacterium]